MLLQILVLRDQFSQYNFIYFSFNDQIAFPSKSGLKLTAKEPVFDNDFQDDEEDEEERVVFKKVSKKTNKGRNTQNHDFGEENETFSIGEDDMDTSNQQKPLTA